MTTQLQICQMALASVGARSTITSITDGSTEAKYCNLYYNPVRDHALRAAYWNFAKTTDALGTFWKAAPGTPENPGAPANPWQRSFPPPPWLYSYLINFPGFIAARSILMQPSAAPPGPPIFSVNGLNFEMSSAPRVPFEIAIDPYDQAGNILTTPNKVVLTSIPTPLIEYTSSYGTGEEANWDSSFVMVMVLALAAHLAIALTSDKQLDQAKLQQANSLIMEARARDGNEGITILDHMPDWLQIRGVGSMGSLSSNFWYPYGPLFPSWPVV